jgi:hypothetical protein
LFTRSAGRCAVEVNSDQQSGSMIATAVRAIWKKSGSNDKFKEHFIYAANRHFSGKHDFSIDTGGNGAREPVGD